MPLTHARLPLFVTQYLGSRGISTPEAAELFLRAGLSRTHDPMDLPNIEPALKRIAQAIHGGELVAAFGDYDVDGVTGAAILVEGLSALGGKAIPYLPDRFTEGYGVNKAALAELRGRGVSLVITVDCGISSAVEVDYANEIGLDIIVVDHHTPPERLPDAIAIVDPKLDDCRYPCTELAACGLAYKVMLALADYLGRPYDPEQHLDLVALGTVCDMAPLEGENRSLVRQGLRSLRTSTRPGLWALAEIARADLGQCSAETLGFILGPRLNAAGRLNHASLAYELITTRDQSRARELASKLHELNLERRRLTLEAAEISKQLVADDPGDSPLLMVGHGRISQGIVGLVASRLVELYQRPAIVYERGEEICKGSARSIPQFNIVEALRDAQPLLTHFGGHRQAAGFAAETRNIEALRKRLAGWTKLQLTGIDLTPVLDYDDEIDLRLIGPETLKWLPFFEPHGLGNPEPVFVGRGLTVVESRAVGDGTHLKLRLRSGDRIWPGIAFGLAQTIPSPGSLIDAAFVIKQGNRGGVDLHVKDFARS